jgi:hypothetical protein
MATLRKLKKGGNRAKFRAFDAENPQVYRELVRLTRRAHDAGVRRMGIAMLFERMRWNHMMRTKGERWKLNNTYRAFYVRKLVRRHPEFAGLFEVRIQKERLRSSVG